MPLRRVGWHGRSAVLLVENPGVEWGVGRIAGRERVVLDDFPAGIAVLVIAGPSKALVVVK